MLKVIPWMNFRIFFKKMVVNSCPRSHRKCYSVSHVTPTGAAAVERQLPFVSSSSSSDVQDSRTLKFAVNYKKQRSHLSPSSSAISTISTHHLPYRELPGFANSRSATSANLNFPMDQNIAAKEDHVKRIRITSHGKIKGWVTFSLQFLLDVSPSKCPL